jgi:aldehyde dehydrogenase (NAD+)
LANSFKNYIAGEWVAGSTEVENINPSDLSDVIGRYAQASSDQLDTALQAATDAQKIWNTVGIEKRYSALMAIGNELIERAEELGTLLAREEGKPMAEGKGEVYRAGQFFT